MADLLRTRHPDGPSTAQAADGAELGDTRDTTPPPGPAVVRARWDAAGAVILGRYRLIECVGEGGMGAVWSAQQLEPVRRLVAVKLIKAGADSKGVLARFEAERQALAVMDHPHIAKILDGGVTETGAPFFVMELVEGVRVTRFCDERGLTPRERLELFVPVCEAIQHAHQKGVIHRDIKPSNVLVALDDAGRPAPKVIDFGVAKATGAALAELTLQTGAGVVVGTPQYMSPEQAGLDARDIDTRSDVYSLGVLLYELLTGGPPFPQRAGGQEGVLEVLRLIREDDPPKPSTRLSAAATPPGLGTDSRRLAGVLRGELDWVVMKALEKDRARRYQSAAEFAADVRRYLAGEAVLAHPPSARYRLRKLLRRHRGPAVAATLVAAALVAGMAGTTAGLLRAGRARDAEAGQRALADAGRARAEAAEALAEGRRKAAVAAQARAMATLRAATGEDVEKLIGARTALGPNERAYLEAIVRRWQEFAKSGGDSPEARSAAAEGAARVAALRGKLGQTEAAIADSRRGTEILAKLAADYPAVPEYRGDLAKTRIDVGNLLKDLGRRAEAQVEYGLAIGAFEKLAADYPADPEYRHATARSRLNLGFLLSNVGRRAEAEVEYGLAIGAFEKLVADFPAVAQYRRALSGCRLNLGNQYTRVGKLPEAEAEYRFAVTALETLVADHPAAPDFGYDLGRTRTSLANLLARVGKRAEAEAQYRRAILTQEKLAADFPAVPDHAHDLARTRNGLGNLLRALDQRPEAEEQYRLAIVGQDKLAADFPAVPDYAHDAAGSWQNLANLLAKAGQTPDAEVAYRRSLASYGKLVAAFPEVPKYRISLGGGCCNFGNMLRDGGGRAECLKWYDQSVATLSAVLSQQPDHATAREFLRNAHVGRAYAHEDLGRPADSAKDWDRAVELSAPAERQKVRDKRARAKQAAGRQAEPAPPPREAK